MLDPAIASLPYLTRKMLAFDEGTSFGLRVDTSATGAAQIIIAGMTRDGPFSFSIVPTSINTIENWDLPLTELPIYFSINTPDNTEGIDQTYVKASLTVNGNPVFTYVSGYVNLESYLAWPGGPNKGPREGDKTLLYLAGTNPAANVEISEVPAADSMWRLIAISFTLVTDANAANRLVTLNITSPSGIIYSVAAPAVQIANTTVRYNFGVGLPHNNNATGLVQTAPLVDGLILPRTISYDTVTTNLQVTDNFSAPVTFFEQYIGVG